jgi:hypothetical protein
LARQPGVEGVSRRQQIRPIDLPQPPSHQLLGGSAGRHDPGRLGDGLIAGLAGVVAVDQVGHATKQPGQRTNLVGHLQVPRPWLITVVVADPIGHGLVA